MASKRHQRWLRRRPVLFGGWFQKRALAALDEDGSPEAVAAMAAAAAETRDENLRLQILACLGRVTHQQCIDAICRAWTVSRSGSLAGLIAERGWEAQAPIEVRILSALKTGRLEIVTHGGGAGIDSLTRACSDADKVVADRAGECLLSLHNPAAVDALCAEWLTSRNSLLAEAISQARYVARHPCRERVFSALQAGRTDLLETSGPEVVDPLLEACGDRDSNLAAQARAVLGHLAKPEARDALCRLVIGGDHSLAREIATAASYAPSDTAERALFFFLAGQWDKYEAVDFNQSILEEAYATADRMLRARIAEKIRQAGRPEWVSLVVNYRQEKRLEDLTDEDWETTCAMLIESARWTEMWRLAQSAPIDWSVRLLRRLQASGWTAPNEEQRSGLAILAGLAAACSQPLEGKQDWALVEPPSLGRLTSLAGWLTGHTGPVSCAAVDSSGEIAATGSNDTTIRLWSLMSGDALHQLTGHTDWVACLAMSPDGAVLASGGRDKSVRFWDIREGRQIGQFANPAGDIRCLAISPDGRWAAAGGDDRIVHLLSVPDGREARALEGHVDTINCLAFSRDGQWLASGSYDQTARLWKMPEGDSAAALSGHKGLVNALVFSPTGDLLATGSKDRTIMLWHLPGGAKLTRLKGHKDDVACLAVSPDGRLLASGSWDNTIRLWNLPDGRLVEVLGSIGTMDGHAGWVTCVGFPPDGQVLVSGSLDNTLRLWQIPGGRLIRVLQGHEQRIGALAVGPDGRALMSAGWDGKAGVWRSRLLWLRQRPLGETSLGDLEWAEDALADRLLDGIERAWVEFLAGLMRWRRRHDIQLEEKAAISVGEFDIEIEG